MLIDTHCHLNFDAFKGKIEQVIDEAKKEGIEKIIVPGVNLKSNRKSLVLARKYDAIYAAIGIHPHHCAEARTKNLEFRKELNKLAKNKKVVAIGECGLDHYQYQKTKYQNYKIDEEFKNSQKIVFLNQIELAQELNLPLIIHNRQASYEILRLLVSQLSRLSKLVFHCFEGDENISRWAIKNNFYLGITGNVTYNKKLQKILKSVPLKNLVLETDAPCLVPEPFKSQGRWPNTPVNVKIVGQWIAKLKGDSFLKVIKITRENVGKLFNI